MGPLAEDPTLSFNADVLSRPMIGAQDKIDVVNSSRGFKSRLTLGPSGLHLKMEVLGLSSSVALFASMAARCGTWISSAKVLRPGCFKFIQFRELAHSSLLI